MQKKLLNLEIGHAMKSKKRSKRTRTRRRGRRRGRRRRRGELENWRRGGG